MDDLIVFKAFENEVQETQTRRSTGDPRDSPNADKLQTPEEQEERLEEEEEMKEEMEGMMKRDEK